ncbi:WbuC family cupin fold metalloprotein [Mesobacillus foraminis]|uniref:WbuC family cupin fold metalloprotein n=1 Tax=Mesobacillus foraminis TaxID=279826 RepID=UPI001BECB12B|nr:WbuC family cupin fold metalloprotein [Mesobacillus foraminis]MBT2758411.1 WbuC family cupin fold metalloprotein [Mesobacillus foraminis]
MYIDKNLLQKLREESRENERKRSHVLLHTSIEDPIQSMLFALQPSTEIGIHRHSNKTETICCLKGKMAVIFYEDNGAIDKVYELSPINPILKFNPSQWHSYKCLCDDTIGWEIKEGPYVLKDFQIPNWTFKEEAAIGGGKFDY